VVALREQVEVQQLARASCAIQDRVGLLHEMPRWQRLNLVVTLVIIIVAIVVTIVVAGAIVSLPLRGGGEFTRVNDYTAADGFRGNGFKFCQFRD